MGRSVDVREIDKEGRKEGKKIEWREEEGWMVG